MTQVTEAVYSDGVLRPTAKLALHEHERVRLIIQSFDTSNGQERARAVEELRSGIERMNFRSTGPYPMRDELHERR